MNIPDELWREIVRNIEQCNEASGDVEMSAYFGKEDETIDAENVYYDRCQTLHEYLNDLLIQVKTSQKGIMLGKPMMDKSSRERLSAYLAGMIYETKQDLHKAIITENHADTERYGDTLSHLSHIQSELNGQD